MTIAVVAEILDQPKGGFAGSESSLLYSGVLFGWQTGSLEVEPLSAWPPIRRNILGGQADPYRYEVYYLMRRRPGNPQGAPATMPEGQNECNDDDSEEQVDR